ncbi:MAG: LPP20 family lipoprotein [Treponema sp.]|jgi:hypothetical protein|nr:LPP20 family lipoprotein [Treponema sp.]
MIIGSFYRINSWIALYVLLFLTVFFITNFTPIHAQPLDKAQTAADDATRRLEEALAGGSAAGTSRNTAPVQATRGGTRPNWVNNPYAAYPRDHYLAAVGTGADRNEAEKRAFAALVAFFGQSVRADFTVAAAYSEAVYNGIITVSENTQVRDTVVTAASLDTLIGAEIGNVWDDGRGTIYALAHIDRERTVAVYTAIILMNQRNIDNLLSMSAAEKNTFDGYARYKLAALIAGMNAEYAGIVSLAGNSNVSTNLTNNLSNAEVLFLEASNIIKNISVGFNVRGDSNNRVRDAFAKVLSGEGLRTQGSNTPYVLDVNISMSEITYPGNSFIFCRYTISANLIERRTGSVLFPFSVSDREGHSTYEAAQTRALVTMERTIAEGYPVLFREYLAALLPF